MNTRHKKRDNARTLTIRTQWAKVNAPTWLPNEDDFLFNPCKSNPNNPWGFYIPTNPDGSSSVIESPDLPDTPQFDNEELEYLKSLWLDDGTITLDDDTEFEMNNTFEVSL